MTDRTAYTQGLRLLADLLDQNPDLKLPYGAGTGRSAAQRITFYYLADAAESKTALARFVRLLPGTVTKEFRDDTIRVIGSLAGLHLEAVAYQAAVCERVIIGTRQVTVPAVPAKPERVETIEDVEWLCGSILADTDTADVTANSATAANA